MNKKKSHLTLGQRYKIEAFIKAGWNQTLIAKELGVNKSTISRELQRNKRKRGSYNASQAQQLTDERKERFGRNRRFTPDVEKYVRDKIIQEQWSPEQINGYCNKQGIKMVSIERIYQYVRNDKALGGDLYKHMRHKLKHRKRPVGAKQTNIKDKQSIDLRPDIINNKERVGDWEIDTIIGKNSRDAIVTICERKTKMTIIRKLPKGKNAEGLAKMVFLALLPYKQKVLSITSDNGSEFAAHKKITKTLDTLFYFAHPYSSWQRGLNENTNGLIRQYIPKGTDFKNIEDEQIKEIQYKINRRPRKSLDYETPLKRFYASLY